MAKRYEIVNQIKDDVYKVQFFIDTHNNVSIPIHKASFRIEYEDEPYVLEQIRPMFCFVSILVENENQFRDLFVEEEAIYEVRVLKNDTTLFIGWLQPDGVSESFVEDKWFIELKATDGLDLLKNLRYVDDNGLPFSGSETLVKILSNALRRTGLEIPIIFNKTGGAFSNIDIQSIEDPEFDLSLIHI